MNESPVSDDLRNGSLTILTPPKRWESERMKEIAASVTSRSTWDEWVAANNAYVAASKGVFAR